MLASAELATVAMTKLQQMVKVLWMCCLFLSNKNFIFKTLINSKYCIEKNCMQSMLGYVSQCCKIAKIKTQGGPKIVSSYWSINKWY